MFTKEKEAPFTPVQKIIIEFCPSLDEWQAVESFMDQYDLYNSEKLVETYQFFVQCYKNLFAQDIEKRLFALMHVFRNRFGKSPIRLINGNQLEFGKWIWYAEGGYIFPEPSDSLNASLQEGSFSENE